MEMWVGRVRGHESLPDDGRKDAFLLRKVAVGAAPIFRNVDAGATELHSSVLTSKQRVEYDKDNLLCASCKTDKRL